MSFLVSHLKSSDGPVREGLENAYVHLARALLNSMPAPRQTEGDWPIFASAIHALDARVAISDGPNIKASDWAAVEVLNCLNHIEVLIHATKVLSDEEIAQCAPTQQSLDEETKEPISDLEGPRFALEAYGGLRYRNNSKLALDLRSLLTRQMDGRRLFLAARSSAWGKTNPSGEITASCSSRHGGRRFSIGADVVGLKPDGNFLIVEVRNITERSS